MQKIIIILLYLLLLGHPIHAFGQAFLVQKSVKELLTLSLDELLDVEVMVASRSEETIFEAPSSVSVFTHQELMRMGITSLEELLNFVPGFIATREIMFGQGYMAAARGSTTPHASYNILFMLDGQRLNNELSGGAFSYNHFITLANVKQVEIIRGPGSALYGAGAFSGVVNIITTTNTNNAFASVGNFNSREIYSNVAKTGEDWNLALFGRYFEDNGDIYTELLDPNVASTRDPRRGKDAYISFDYGKFELDLRYMTRKLSDFYQRGELGNGINYDNAEQNFISTSYRLFETDNALLKLQASYAKSSDHNLARYYTFEELQQVPNLITTGDRDFLVGTVSEESEAQLGVDGYYKFNPQHTLFAGAHWRRPKIDKHRDVGNYSLADFEAILIGGTNELTYYGMPIEYPPTFDEGHRNITDFYLQHKYQINQYIATTLGIRYDHYSDIGSTTNPRFALNYTPFAKTQFKFLYGEAFKAPSIRQLHVVGLGNPSLKPERVETLELAWLQEYKFLQTTLTYYHNRALDKIDTILLPITGRQFVNAENSVTTAGWELEALARFDNGFSLRTAYSYATETELNPQRFPTHTFSLIGNYHYNKWNFNANAYYHSEMEQQTGLNSFVTLDDYWVVNTALRYALTEDIEITGRIRNIFDKDYYSSSKVVAFDEGLPNRGRSYDLGILLRF